MEDTNMQQKGVVKCIYLPADLAGRLDGLAEKGAITSNVVAVCVRQALSGIEKKFEIGKTGGLRIRKTKLESIR